jgi:hypothetical protein
MKPPYNQVQRLEHFSHRYALANDGEEQLSLMESCQSLCASAYICASNALIFHLPRVSNIEVQLHDHAPLT